MGWNWGLRARIWVLGRGFGLRGWDSGLEAGIWAEIGDVGGEISSYVKEEAMGPFRPKFSALAPKRPFIFLMRCLVCYFSNYLLATFMESRYEVPKHILGYAA